MEVVMSSRKKVQRLGRLADFDYSELTKDQGHSYGKGRPAVAHDDKRGRRKQTRKDRVRESMRGW
jgi:hypothetical protein